MNIIYPHWTEVPYTVWKWPNFTPKEIASTGSHYVDGKLVSKGNGSILINNEALDCLQRARDILGKPMVVSSAYRDKEHNRKIGSNDTSMHRLGRAFDIKYENKGKEILNRLELYLACRDAGFTGFGFYPTFLHVDTGRPRNWTEGPKWPELKK